MATCGFMFVYIVNSIQKVIEINQNYSAYLIATHMLIYAFHNCSNIKL